MPRIYHEPKFDFWDKRRLPGVIDLQIFQRSDNKIVVVISELIHTDGSEANHGISATDGIEQLATHIYKLGFTFDTLIQHYPGHGPMLDLARSDTPKRETQETFHLVTLRWDESAERYRVDHAAESWAWKQISRAEAETLIGEPFQLHGVQRPDDRPPD